MPASTIVHVVERMAPGGIETLVLDMVRGMAGRHVVFSLSGTRDELSTAWPRLTALGPSLEAFDRQPGLQPRLITRLARRMAALKPETVIVHHVGPLIYGGLAARLARVPTIVHVEHEAWHYQSARRRQVAAPVFKLVRPRRVAVSEEIAGKVAEHFVGASVTVIAPGIDMTEFRPRDRAAARARLGLFQIGRSQTGALIGTSGRLVPVKAQATLIEALALCRDRIT